MLCQWLLGARPGAERSPLTIAFVRECRAAAWLVVASIVFYGYWNPKFVLLLLASATFNYLAGIFIASTAGKRRHWGLGLSVTINLSILAYYKYANFFITSVASLGVAGLQPLDIILPLGISFFTFTQIAFLVDVYRGIAREYNFTHYLLFVTFFPHLIAGPILHHKDMIPQFEQRETYRLQWKNIALGLTFFAVGLTKKVLIADKIAPVADLIFDAARDGKPVLFFDAWAGAFAYTFQLYFDFSGYSDMAIGLALLFNIRFPINFNSPYQARNIIDFWRRWHITLSAFLREYLYIPLGGNRHGSTRRYSNLMITMLLGGLWHGANWTFVLWGLLHGVFLVVNNLWLQLKRELGWRGVGPIWLRNTIATVITFLCVVVAWVLFRAETVSAAVVMLKGMGGMNGVSVSATFANLYVVQSIVSSLSVPFETQGFFPQTISLGSLSNNLMRPLLIAASIALFLPNIQDTVQYFIRRRAAFGDALFLLRQPSRYAGWNVRLLAMTIGLLLGYALVSIETDSPFLYFQF